MTFEVGRTDELAAVAEQVLAPLTGLAVLDVGLGWADRFPGFDELADDGVDRLGEGAVGLVLRDAQEADREGLAGLVVGAFVPDDAVELQTTDLVDAATGEEPHPHNGAQHLDRVVAGVTAAGGVSRGGAVGPEVLGVDGQPSGHELGPGGVVDDPGG